MKSRKGLYPVLLGLGLIVFAGIVYAGTYNPNCQGAHTGTSFDCYRAPGVNATPSSPTVQVQEWNENKCLVNLNQPDILVPTNTSAEWGAFKTAAQVSSLHVTMADPTNGSCGGGPGGDPEIMVTGAVGIYLPSTYCLPNSAQAMLASIARARGLSAPAGHPLWLGIRTDIANQSDWSTTTKANANLVVDALVPEIANPPYHFVNNQYWGGYQSGEMTKNGQTFEWDTTVYEGAPTDPCTDPRNQAGPYQADSVMHITGPY